MREVIEQLGPDGLAERSRLRDAYLNRQGITFSLSGRERPLPLDLIPRVVAAAEWDRVEAGIRQRIRALEMFLADVYGLGEILNDGVIPRHLITSSRHYHRAAFGLVPPNLVRIHVAGIDLIRDEKGEFRVLEDNLRCPSGVSYVLENRRTLAHVLPEVFAAHQMRSVAEYPERLLDALRSAAPSDISDPTVVVLTPGVHNSAHFEHAFLARRMGVELVEGRDLFCRDDRLWMRTVRGPRPVHVVYRRIDDEFLDPVHFEPDSLLGVPGLLNTARAGNVVGGGDWAADRIIPDAVRAITQGSPLAVRNPGFTRPWQHVLDPLCGYLCLGARLKDTPSFEGPWNFGPPSQSCRTVGELAAHFFSAYGEGSWEDHSSVQSGAPHETDTLVLDVSKAARMLGWRTRLGFEAAVDRTAHWYRALALQASAYKLCAADIEDYLNRLH